MATASSNKKPALLGSSKQKGSTRGLVSDSIATGVIFALALTVGQRVVGFGRGILFCRLMDDQQLGQWSMVWSYMMLLAPLAVLGLPGCFGKFTEHYRTRGQLQTFIRRIAWISAATTLMMSAAILLFPAQFAYILFRDPQQVTLVRFLGVAILLVSASNFLTSLMESLRQVRVVTIMRFVTGVLFAIVGTAMLNVWEDGASAATVGFAISCGIGSLPAIWILWKYREGLANDGEQLTQSHMWKRIAPYAVWLWATNLLANLFEVSDRYMLIHWSDLPANLAQGSVGQYHSGRVVPLLMISVAAMLAGVLLPYLSQAWEAGNKAQVKKQLNWTIKLISLFFTTGGVLILLLSPILFGWILQGRYDGGLSVLPLTLVYCIWFGMATVGQDYLWVAEKGKWVALVAGISLLVNVVLNMVLIPLIALQGAVLATLIGNATALILIYFLNQKFECKTDTGVWLTAALPLILLLDKELAVLTLIVILVVSVMTELVLSKEEKSDLSKLITDKLGKFLPNKRS